MSEIGPRVRLRAVVVAIAIAIALSLSLAALQPPSAGAQTISSLHVSLTPNRPGALATLSLSIHYEDPQASVPTPLRRAVFRLPESLAIEVPHLRSCSPAKLHVHGPRICPAQSRLGGGAALVEVQAGSQILAEQVTLSAFIGPLIALQPTFALDAQGFTPFEKSVVLTGLATPDEPPYGEQLQIAIPPIATLPLEPDASIVELRLSLGPRSRAHLHGANAVLVPTRCPPGGLPFAVQSSFADGSSTSNSTFVPCH